MTDHPPKPAPHLVSHLADMDSAPDPRLFEPLDTEPPYERYVLTTPFHNNVAELSKTNQWADWAGYTTPLVYTHIDEEYQALRGRTAISDISPLRKARISGRDASAYLNRLVTRDISGLARGQSAYVMFCEDRGFIVGDGILFHIGEDDYRLTTGDSHIDWLLDSARGFRVLIEDVSRTVAALALQGPGAAAILAAAGVPALDGLALGDACWVELRGMPLYISRTGQTGGLGYELWVDPEDAPPLWDWLMRCGAPLGLAPAGLAVRDLARLEAGIPQAGIDYLGAFSAVDLLSARTPFELGLGAHVDLDAGLFTGRDALRALQGEPGRLALTGLEIEGGEAVRFAAIYAGEDRVGTATSVGWSPLLGRTIALATVSVECLKAGQAARGLNVHIDDRHEVAVRRRRLAAKTVDRPFLLHHASFQPDHGDLK